MRLAVVGSGTMGRGITYAAALAGCEVRLFDARREATDATIDAVGELARRGVAGGRVEADTGARVPELAVAAGSLAEAVSGADVVVETISENLEAKRAILARAEQAAPAEAIFATNTSALSITAVMASLADPSRGVGMHFFNPVYAMALIEVVAGLETSPATTERAKELAVTLGKTPIVVNDHPGFVTSRINVMIGNEAFRMLQEGVASAEDIDRALKLGLNHPMGPFELVDLVGLDVRLSILEGMHRDLGEQFRPAPLLVKYVNAGRLGRKVGRGVFEYADPATS